jgi:hypothetical protein
MLVGIPQANRILAKQIRKVSAGSAGSSISHRYPAPAFRKTISLEALFQAAVSGAGLAEGDGRNNLSCSKVIE